MNNKLKVAGIIAVLFLATSKQIKAAPSIVSVSDNKSSYTENLVPKYEKFEIDFDIENSTATNFFFPYDPAPPAGVTPSEGISVDTLFLPPGVSDWNQAYKIPSFYYQNFSDQVIGSREWFYPMDYSWKTRFAPTREGVWQYKIVATDAGGSSESQTYSFSVSSSSNKGFVKVSPTDKRYFVFENGDFFPGLGYNMNYNQVDWTNPVLGNQENFTKMKENGIQLVRIWLSQWGIYGSSYNPWKSIDPWWVSNLTYNAPGLTREDVFDPESELAMKVSTDGPEYPNQCIFLGWNYSTPSLKRNTNYKISIKYRVNSMTGPLIPNYDWGFVVKTGGWLWGDSDSQKCFYPGTGNPLTSRIKEVTSDWQTLEIDYFSGTNDFLPYLYLVLENVTSGKVYIDQIDMRENMGDGNFGVNIISRPDMDYHRYIDQRNAYAFDKVVQLAKDSDVYLKTVIHEKHDPVLNSIDYSGNWTTPASGNANFYGNWRVVTRVRWYQQAWWRYLQARWGYSTSIHSWELVNEGDPYSGLHYTITDEMAKYMHQFSPNSHLASTSTWHSFPIRQFWKSSNYPNIDYADVHFYAHQDTAQQLRADRDTDCCQYIPIFSTTDFYDSVNLVNNLSREIGAYQPYGVEKPIIRGEFGLWGLNYVRYDAITNDTQAVWLHNYVWAQINPGGMYDASYWWPNVHIYARNSNGTYRFDHRNKFKNYYNFIKDIPLGTGIYEDVAASVSNSSARVLGQKDTESGKAHLWVQNVAHTWKNVVDGVNISPIDATITISGFAPNTTFQMEHWNTQTGIISQTSNIESDNNGSITINVQGLTTDTAFKIGDYSQSPTPTNTPLLGDANGDGSVDGVDYVVWLTHYQQGSTNGSVDGDFNTDGNVDGIDYILWLNNYGV